MRLIEVKVIIVVYVILMREWFRFSEVGFMTIRSVGLRWTSCVLGNDESFIWSVTGFSLIFSIPGTVS